MSLSFEPGIDCMIQSVNGDGEKIVYGEHVLGKMKGWVQFQDLEKHAAIVEQIEIIEPDMAGGEYVFSVFGLVRMNVILL